MFAVEVIAAIVIWPVNPAFEVVPVTTRVPRVSATVPTFLTTIVIFGEPSLVPRHV